MLVTHYFGQSINNMYKSFHNNVTTGKIKYRLVEDTHK